MKKPDDFLDIKGYQKTLKYADKLRKKILLKLKKHGKNAKNLTDTIDFILERKF